MRPRRVRTGRGPGGGPSRPLEQAFHDQVGLSPPRPTLKVDAQAELLDLDLAFNRHLETLRPFGPGNPAPVIVCLGVQCLGSRVINQRHLKVRLAQGGNVLEAIAFDMAAHHPLERHPGRSPGHQDIALPGPDLPGPAPTGLGQTLKKFGF